MRAPIDSVLPKSPPDPLLNARYSQPRNKSSENVSIPQGLTQIPEGILYCYDQAVVIHGTHVLE